MKRGIIISIIGILVLSGKLSAQTFTPTSNSSYIGLDKNLLFNSQSRYQVTQTGSRPFNTALLFDGSFAVQYITGFDGDTANEVVIEISGLPATHTQNGAFIGFTTRALPPKIFKIEVYDTYNSANEWKLIADVTNNTSPIYTIATPNGGFPKIRFTFSKAVYETGTKANMIGISELFFVHNEAAKAYDGLMVQYATNGNVGIGTATPNAKLAVNGNIRAKEIKVETANWPDYVFAKDYELPSLTDTENHIKEKGHLPGIPSAEEVKANGIELGEMNAKLLKKIEELTLYLIEMKKDNELEKINNLEQKKIIYQQQKDIKYLKSKIK
jgi:hypothetical protein